MSERRPLGDLFTLEYGNALPSERRSGHGYPVFGSSGLVGLHREPLVPGPGIIVGRKGTVGSITWSENDFWPIDTTYFVQPKTTLSLRWLFWLLKSLPLNRLDTSTGVPGLNRNDVAEINTFVPSFPEQRRIAEILDTLDRTIKGTQRIIAKLQTTRLGLLHELMPRGATSLTMAHCIARIEGGGTPSRDTDAYWGGKIPWASVKDFSDDNLWLSKTQETITEAGLKYSASRLIEEVTIIICTRMAVGRLAINTKPVAINQDLKAIYVKPGNDMEYVARYLAYVRPLMEAVAIGSTVKGISIGQIERLPWHDITLEEQQRIVETLLTFDKALLSEQARLAKLQALKRGLMDDLLTGRVRVPLPTAEVQDNHAGRAIQPKAQRATEDIPAFVPSVQTPAPHAVMFRAAGGAKAQAMTDWTRQLAKAVAGQPVAAYNPEALDKVLPELLELTAKREGIQRVPEVLAKAGVRFMLLPHTSKSKANGAAFYLDEERIQPVVGLSFRNPYLDTFWFNLLHELAHIRLGHSPVADESLEEYDRHSPDERAANEWAENVLIPPKQWEGLFAKYPVSEHQLRAFARQLGRHIAITAGRYGYVSGDWGMANQPKLRPNVLTDLKELEQRLRETGI